jgi:hypothetical protein
MTMRREVYFALAAGALIGLIIAFGAIRANSTIKPNGVEEEIATTKQVQTDPVYQEFGLDVTFPQEFDVLTTSTVDVEGVTGPDNLIAISSPKDDYVLVADSKGLFKQTVNLEGGVNKIIVTSFSENDVDESSITVVYSSEFSKILGGSQEDGSDL